MLLYECYNVTLHLKIVLKNIPFILRGLKLCLWVYENIGAMIGLIHLWGLSCEWDVTPAGRGLFVDGPGEVRADTVLCRRRHKASPALVTDNRNQILAQGQYPVRSGLCFITHFPFPAKQTRPVQFCDWRAAAPRPPLPAASTAVLSTLLSSQLFNALEQSLE